MYATWSFAVICDPQLGFGGLEQDVAAFELAVQRINDLPVDHVLICGDLVNAPTEELFEEFNNIKAEFSVLCYCAPGNHDLTSGEDVVNPQQGHLADYRRLIGEDYFSVEHKGFLFVIANSQFWVGYLQGESERHDEWLRERLKYASRNDLAIIIVDHFCLYQKEPSEENCYWTIPSPKRQELLALLEKYRVKAFLSGHRHQPVIHDYRGTLLVTGEATGKSTSATDPMLGFRVWQVAADKTLTHAFMSLDM